MIFLFAHFLIIPAENTINLGGDLGITALVGIVILVLLALTPRIPFVGGYIKLRYDQWRFTHRFIGLFFITGIIHSLIVPAVIVGSSIVSLYVYTIAYSAAAAYIYKELLEGILKKKHTYVVEAVQKLNGSVLEITLKPHQEKIRHRAGQFLYISFGGDKALGEAHPFTISSSPDAEYIRLAVRAVGDFTQHMYANLRSGMQARLEGGYGMFEYNRGAKQQIWIAGGIGITPFLSWIRDFGIQIEHTIDFYYTVRGPEEALYLEEINEAVERHANFRLHLTYSNKDGRLSAEKIVASSGPLDDKEIYLCGPLALIEALRKQFIELGVPARRIHYEEFSFR
jgi:predicted ferric reductase